MSKESRWVNSVRVDALRGTITARLLESLSRESLSLLWEINLEGRRPDLSLWVLPNVLVDSDGVKPPLVRVPPYRFNFLGLREVFDDAEAFHLANIAEPLLDIDHEEGEDDRGVRLVVSGTFDSLPVRFIFFAQRRHDKLGLVVYYSGNELLKQRPYDPEFDQGLFT